MTEQELKDANRRKVPVEWRGRQEYECALGQVTAIIYRYLDGKEVISVEITSFGDKRSCIICRPEDVHLWAPVHQTT